MRRHLAFAARGRAVSRSHEPAAETRLAAGASSRSTLAHSTRYLKSVPADPFVRSALSCLASLHFNRSGGIASTAGAAVCFTDASHYFVSYRSVAWSSICNVPVGYGIRCHGLTPENSGEDLRQDFFPVPSRWVSAVDFSRTNGSTVGTLYSSPSRPR